MKQFEELFSKKDTVGQIQLLNNWEKTNSNDPELYVAYYNYYVMRAREEVITLGNDPKGKEALKIVKEDSLSGNPVAYMYSDTYYDRLLLYKAYSYIDKGIEKCPNRLDMRFGKIYMLGENKDYQNFTKEIIKTIEYSSVINNKWLWQDNAPVEDPQAFMLSSIQSYVLQLYNTGEDALLDNMKMIAECILKQYPAHIESLSNLSIVYLIRKQYDEALATLARAEKINNKDYIILNNMAHAYKEKGDIPKAIEYYNLTIKYGDEEAQKYAKEEIELLKKM
nr:tetratricopeptide repeat protein [uncultured Bacteroides sp.]